MEAAEASNLDAWRHPREGGRQIDQVAVIAAADGSARLAALGTSTDLHDRRNLNPEMVRALLGVSADSALENGEGDGHAVHDGKLSLTRHRPKSISRHPREVSKSLNRGIPTSLRRRGCRPQP